MRFIKTVPNELEHYLQFLKITFCSFEWDRISQKPDLAHACLDVKQVLTLLSSVGAEC
jgi:hypothetical protein